jgi:pimeloyl-ACP methyl ester carboxylesterase
MTPADLTYVLVHGGGVTGRFWDRLVPFLDAPAVAVDLPGRNGKPGDLGTLTVDDEVASVLADVRAEAPHGPIVLVAHSSGGLVVPGVVAGLGGRVVHIILNAASVPPEGGCGLDCMQARHREGVEWVFANADPEAPPMTTSGPPDDPEAFRRAYGGEPLDDDTLAYVVDPGRCVRDTMNHYRQPVHWSLVGDVPVTYVLTEQDRPIPPELQETMIGRLPHAPTVIRLDSGHLPPITDPAHFAEILHAAAATSA